MAGPISVTCSECGAQLKLKSRASLGKKRPCPKCKESFKLIEDAQESYDLDARDAEPSAPRPQSKPESDAETDANSSNKKPILIIVGAGVAACVIITVASHFLSDRTNEVAPAQQTTQPGAPAVDTNTNTTATNSVPSTPTQNQHPVIDRSGSPIDVLALVDPHGDTLQGRWERDGNVLKGFGSSKIKVPLPIEKDYRVRMKFTREAEQQVMLALSAAGSRFVIAMNFQYQDQHGIGSVSGRLPNDPKNPTFKTYNTDVGQECEVVADVKTVNNSVELSGTFNGQPFFQWNGPANQLDNPYWKIPTPIGFGTQAPEADKESVVRFSELTVSWLDGSSTNPPAVSVATNNTNTPPQNNTPPTRAVSTANNGSGINNGDTTGFRAPGYGTYAGSGLPDQWSATQNMVWKTPLPGAGSSSPITLGNRIYLTAYSGYGQSAENPGELSGLKYHVLSINRNSGQVEWSTPINPIRDTIGYRGFLHQHGYASHTLATDGQRLFAYFGNSGAYGFDLEGNQLWHVDCGQGVDGFGSGASPIVHGDNVIFNASVESQALIAIDRASGSVAWKTQKELRQGYTTPIIVTAGPRTEVVVASRAGLTGFDVASGNFLWEWHGGGGNNYACATPVVHSGIIYGQEHRVATLSAIRPGGNGDVSDSHRVWHGTTRYAVTVVSPVYFNQHVFWPTDGRIGVFDATSGELVKQARGGWDKLYSSPIVANGKLYIVSRFNGTFVLGANRDLNELAHNVIEGDDSQFNASPVVNREQLLLRSDQSLYCVGAQ